MLRAKLLHLGHVHFQTSGIKVNFTAVKESTRHAMTLHLLAVPATDSADGRVVKLFGRCGTPHISDVRELALVASLTCFIIRTFVWYEVSPCWNDTEHWFCSGDNQVRAIVHPILVQSETILLAIKNAQGREL